MIRERIRAPWWMPASAVLVVAVAVAVIFVARSGDDPEDVVGDYLSLLHSRDAEEALAYTGELSELNTFSRDLLVPAAMAEDWEVTNIARRHNEDDDPASVDVTITAADGTAREGRFNLAENADGDWVILNPLVRLGIDQLPADFIELNGVSTTAREFWLFPGSYRVFGSLGATVAAPTYVAVPPSGDGRSEDGSSPSITTESYLPLFTAGPEQTGVLRQQFAAWLDTCAATVQPNPEGCPFKAGYGGLSRVALDDGSEYDTDTVVWEVEKYPEVRLKQGPGNFSLVTVTPGLMRISGEGRPYYYRDRPVEKFSAVCGLSLETVDVRLAPGGFAFSTRDVFSSTCIEPYS